MSTVDKKQTIRYSLQNVVLLDTRCPALGLAEKEEVKRKRFNNRVNRK